MKFMANSPNESDTNTFVAMAMKQTNLPYFFLNNSRYCAQFSGSPLASLI